MFAGVALALSELPVELIERHRLERRICDRGGEREVQFLFADAERVLPVWINGQLKVLRWGNRRARVRAYGHHGAISLWCGGWRKGRGAPVVRPMLAARRRRKVSRERLGGGHNSAIPSGGKACNFRRLSSVRTHVASEKSFASQLTFHRPRRPLIIAVEEVDRPNKLPYEELRTIRVGDTAKKLDHSFKTAN